MPCDHIVLGDGTHVLVKRGKQRVPKCRWCSRPSTKLCDFRISPPEVVTHAKTCDAPMCDAHAKSVGPNRDYCPEHGA